jgi:hypothetical protein
MIPQIRYFYTLTLTWPIPWCFVKDHSACGANQTSAAAFRDRLASSPHQRHRFRPIHNPDNHQIYMRGY